MVDGWIHLATANPKVLGSIIGQGFFQKVEHTNFVKKNKSCPAGFSSKPPLISALSKDSSKNDFRATGFLYPFQTS
jgi:hypothetical protein